MAAQPPPIWKFWQPSPILEKEDIEDDLTRIRQFYRNEGFFDAEAAVSVTIVRQAAEASAVVASRGKRIGAGRTPQRLPAVAARRTPKKGARRRSTVQAAAPSATIASALPPAARIRIGFMAPGGAASCARRRVAAT